jgi:hypothetical protein
MHLAHESGAYDGGLDFTHWERFLYWLKIELLLNSDSTVMLVRIRLRHGPTVRQKARKNRHIALASAALLTPAALTAFVLSMWRLGADLGFARSFAIHTGILSHWQVWLAISVAIQFIAVVLNRYGNPEPEIHELEIGNKKPEAAGSESPAVVRPL